MLALSLLEQLLNLFFLLHLGLLLLLAELLFFDASALHFLVLSLESLKLLAIAPMEFASAAVLYRDHKNGIFVSWRLNWSNRRCSARNWLWW